MIVYFWEVCLDAEQMSFMRVLWKFQSPRNQLLELRASYNYLTPLPPQSSSIIFIGIENSLKKLIVNWILLPEGKIYFIAICETRKKREYYLQKSYSMIFSARMSETWASLWLLTCGGTQAGPRWSQSWRCFRTTSATAFTRPTSSSRTTSGRNSEPTSAVRSINSRWVVPFIFMKTAISTFLISEAVAITATQYWCRC